MQDTTLPFTSRRNLASVVLWLPYPPSVNALWIRSKLGLTKSGKNRRGLIKSDRYRAWLAEAHVAWLQQRLQLSVKSIKGQYSITILAHPRDKRHRDLGNLEKVISDFLQTVGVIENDSLACRIVQEWNTITVPIDCVVVTISPYP